MAKMRIYTVHIRANAKNPYENPVFIEESFNFFAFVFFWIWALYNRLWLVGGLLLAYEALVRVLALQGFITTFTGFLLGICAQVLLGFHANDLLREKLRRKGYITSDIVTSDNQVGAEQRFFERYFPLARPLPPLRHLPG